MNFVKRILGFDISLQIKKHAVPKPITVIPQKPKSINETINFECFWGDENGYHYETSFCHYVPGRTEYWSS